MIRRRNRSIEKFAFDDQRIAGAAKNNRRAENSKMLRVRLRRIVGKLNFPRRPLTARHHSKSVQRARHGKFTKLARLFDTDVGIRISEMREMTIDI